jgi:hypothetical protein
MPTITGFLKDNDGIFIEKDAVSVLTYTLDWSEWLPSGTTLSGSTFTVQSISGDATPLAITAQSNTTTSCTVKLSAGSVGKIYKVFNTITTSGSLTDKRFFRIKVETRSL